MLVSARVLKRCPARDARALPEATWSPLACPPEARRRPLAAHAGLVVGIFIRVCTYIREKTNTFCVLSAPFIPSTSYIMSRPGEKMSVCFSRMRRKSPEIFFLRSKTKKRACGEPHLAPRRNVRRVPLYRKMCASAKHPTSNLSPWFPLSIKCYMRYMRRG